MNMKEIEITDKEYKDISEMLCGCACYIVLSNKGVVSHCETPMFMSLITKVLKDMYRKGEINDDTLMYMIKFIKNSKNISKLTPDEIKDVLDNMEDWEDNKNYYGLK